MRRTVQYIRKLNVPIVISLTQNKSQLRVLYLENLVPLGPKGPGYRLGWM